MMMQQQNLISAHTIQQKAALRKRLMAKLSKCIANSLSYACNYTIYIHLRSYISLNLNLHVLPDWRDDKRVQKSSIKSRICARPPCYPLRRINW